MLENIKRTHTLSCDIETNNYIKTLDTLRDKILNESKQFYAKVFAELERRKTKSLATLRSYGLEI
jgi:hypothetical protein